MRRSWFPTVSETWWPHWAISEKVAGIVYCVQRVNNSQTNLNFHYLLAQGGGDRTSYVGCIFGCSRAAAVKNGKFCQMMSFWISVVTFSRVIPLFSKHDSALKAFWSFWPKSHHLLQHWWRIWVWHFWSMLMKMHCCEISSMCHLHRSWFPSVSETWWPRWAILANVGVFASKRDVQTLSNLIYRISFHVGVVD